MCTLRRGMHVDSSYAAEGWGEETSPAFAPITITHQEKAVTLRPWDPSQCVIAAGIHNRLIHFPFREGSRVFALDCSLQTLSHIADIVGQTGKVVGVMCHQQPQPTSAHLTVFFKLYPNVSVIRADVRTATFETYERMLSLPQSSKQAFLMGLHPRVGAKSPVRLLANHGASSESLVRRIFDFVTCQHA
eukprot:CAMPEP_0180805954 /NCGR_PEP_ID=MMETSP1038_2-20121128/62319_1 /TAXON_ID=632150 /ORGANISM="Azadinium spinosum, Strain 3D9" /LENGTH=188 /DNA_ID=CAMNT_0022846597 /DNA_START=5 /DNA_END=567 /DNA_ORIENTATION=-